MNLERIYTIIDQPHTSEKSSIMADKFKQFTFRVLNSATKQEIKSAVEHLFKVEVKAVNILNYLGKTKRFKNRNGKRSNFKKAYVTLKENFDINFSEVE